MIESVTGVGWRRYASFDGIGQLLGRAGIIRDLTPMGSTPHYASICRALKSGMSDPRNVAHDKKVIHEKQLKGENLSKGAAHVPQPGKKTALEKSHGAHKETEAEEAGGTDVGSST